MANKTKNKATLNQVTDAAKQGGIVLMAAAATLGLVEVPHDPDKRAIVPNQPTLATAPDFSHPTGTDELRREREETHSHSHSYSVSQRTPGRTGKI